jgi:dihydropteroate synthase
MGIVNVTPDSFSGDGTPDAGDAIEHALAQNAASADIIDLGAESTRPGHAPVDVAEELRRLIPVVRGVRERLPDAILSVDTFKSEVFRAAHAAGADMLNSVWGLDGALLEAAVECDVPVVIMHNKAEAKYDGSVVDEVLRSLDASAARAVNAGLRRERVILDPGIGFGKTPEHNLEILAALPRIVGLGFPTLLGTSRKSTLGRLTGKPVEGRAFATAATVALAVAAGIDVVRVHDVTEMRDVVAVADAIARGWRPENWGMEQQ